MGKILDKNLWEWGVVDFGKISAPHFPKYDDGIVKKLSTDQQMLYKLCVAVITG